MGDLDLPVPPWYVLCTCIHCGVNPNQPYRSSSSGLSFNPVDWECGFPSTAIMKRDYPDRMLHVPAIFTLTQLSI